MPYITRDAGGKITKISTRDTPGLEQEALPHNHPEVMAFLDARGQSAQQVQKTIDELRRTDGEMARAIEDIIMVLFKKNLVKMTDLPKPVQDRMALRVKLRMLIQDAYEQASSRGG